MNYSFNYEQYRAEAIRHKQTKSIPPEEIKTNAKRKTRVVGDPYPILPTYSTIYNRITPDLLEATAKVAPVQRSLRQLELIAFPWFEFNVVAPGVGEAENKQEQALLDRMKQEDKRLKTNTLCKQSFYDLITYGSALFERVWVTTKDGWIVPNLQRLPAKSFSYAVPEIQGNPTRYLVGRILKGIVYDKQEQRMRFFQKQSTSSVPVEIDAENVIHLKDECSNYVDGDPYLAGIVSTVTQLEFARKRMMQTVSRGGAPNAIVKVGLPDSFKDDTGSKDLTTAMPGAGTTPNDQIYTDLWEYATLLVQNQSSDTAIAVPEGVDFQYQNIPISLDPTVPDSYLIRELISHIFPRDVLEVLSQSISTTSAPLLELLKMMIQGWQAVCSTPFEKVWTEFAQKNGFDLYEVYFDWAPFIPDDPANEHKLALEKFMVHTITLDEYRESIGLDPLDKAQRVVIYEELTRWKSPAQPPQQQFGQAGASEDGDMGPTPTEGNELTQPTDLVQEEQKLNEVFDGVRTSATLDEELMGILRDTGSIAMKVLKSANYFEVSKTSSIKG